MVLAIDAKLMKKAATHAKKLTKLDVFQKNKKTTVIVENLSSEGFDKQEIRIT